MTETNRRTFLQHAAAGSMAAVALQPSLLARVFDRQIQVGLIGAGRQGRAILSELQKFDHVTVAGVSDVVASRLRSGLRRAQGAEGFEDYRKLLEKQEITAVFVATPTHLHRQVCADALAAGKHVYCESPLASTVEDARAIALAARGTERVFAVGLQGRSNPVYALARSFHLSGSLKDVVSLHAQNHRKTSWRTPASDPKDERALNWRLDPETSTGLAGEWGTQQFDVFHWYLGAYPESVRGRGSVRFHKDGRKVHDTVQAALSFPDGVELSWQATLANSYAGRYEQLNGSMASIKLAWTHGWMFKEADSPTQGWEVYANRQTFHNDEGITLIADATQLASQGKLKEGVGLPESSLYYAVEDFLAVTAAGQPPACTVEEGMRGTIVGILTDQAIRSGENVTIDPKLFELG